MKEEMAEANPLKGIMREDMIGGIIKGPMTGEIVGMVIEVEIEAMDREKNTLAIDRTGIGSIALDLRIIN